MNIYDDSHLGLLFSQIGLENNSDAIELFINTHQLPPHQLLCDAPFWNKSQKEFLKSCLIQDDDWSIIIDELNQKLHMDTHIQSVS